MKHVFRLLQVLFYLGSGVGLAYLWFHNAKLAAEVKKLEAELGRMTIHDENQVYLVEIEKPKVPPEVAAHLLGVWQFRCYLPANYNYILLSGGGRVTKEGIFVKGGHSSSWRTASPTPIHELMTVSLHNTASGIEAFYSIGGVSSTSSWYGINQASIKDVLVEKLVSSKRGARSFNQETILPLLKVYNPHTAQRDQVAGKVTTNYAGGLIVLAPKSLEPALNQLRSGERPNDFHPEWLATAVSDE